MPGDELKKVSRGQPLRIPATAYNSFVDAALDFRNRSLALEGEARQKDTRNGILYVQNGTGVDLPQFSVVGLSEPVIFPSENEPEFRNRVVLLGATPLEVDHRGRFGILAEPIGEGKVGLCFVDGVCQARIYVASDLQNPRFADVIDEDTGYLKATGFGSATILWREGGSGNQWAVIRFGKSPAIFPVELSEVGGESGDATSPATWIYEVLEPVGLETIAWDVDPTSFPHRWKRPEVGYMHPATFGYAHFDGDGQVVLGWLNEVPGQEPCG